MEFLKIQAKNFALPFPQLFQLVKSEQKLKYSMHFHDCDMVVKVRPLSKIKRKAEAKGSFVFRPNVKLIHADKEGGHRSLCTQASHIAHSATEGLEEYHHVVLSGSGISSGAGM